MRIYQNFKEALPEIKRDLAEMGIKVHPQTYQDKFIGDDPDFETLELQNYIYTVVNPNMNDLEPTQPWADAEWSERKAGIQGEPVNPGEAYKLRKEIWEQFLDESGRFSYTYGERLSTCDQITRVIDRLRVDRDSRQLFVVIWSHRDVMMMGGISRIPCTIGYQFQCRKNKINITYLERSADFATHFVNDVYLAKILQTYVAIESGFVPGTFTHWIGSLHIFNKDVKEVF